MNLVLDSSVVIAASRRAETYYADAVAFFELLRAAVRSGMATVSAELELWFEVHVAEERTRTVRRAPWGGAALLGALSESLVAPVELDDVASFLEHLDVSRPGHVTSPRASR